MLSASGPSSERRISSENLHRMPYAIFSRISTFLQEFYKDNPVALRANVKYQNLKECDVETLTKSHFMPKF